MTPLLIAVAASSFNLVCTGTAYHVDKLFAPAERKNVHPFEVIYRVNLTTKRYCQGPCTTTSSLAEVSETSIVFVLDQNQSYDSMIFANRDNGNYINRQRWYGENVEVNLASGKCQRTPFTGFPTRKF